MFQSFVRFPECVEFTKFLIHLGKTPLDILDYCVNYLQNNKLFRGQKRLFIHFSGLYGLKSSGNSWHLIKRKCEWALSTE